MRNAISATCASQLRGPFPLDQYVTFFLEERYLWDLITIQLGWLRGSGWLWWHFKVFRVWGVRCQSLKAKRWHWFGDLGTFWKRWHWFGDILKGRIGQFGAGRKSKWTWGMGWGLEWLYKLTEDFSFHFAQQRHSRDPSFHSLLLKSPIYKTNRFERRRGKKEISYVSQKILESQREGSCGGETTCAGEEVTFQRSRCPLHLYPSPPFCNFHLPGAFPPICPSIFLHFSTLHNAGYTSTLLLGALFTLITNFESCFTISQLFA